MDYAWDLDPGGITLDEELNTKNLGWKNNDVFKLITVGNQQRLVKLDDVEKFIKGYNQNGLTS
jgi:hypothetical protein